MMLCTWCGEEIKSGAFMLVGDQPFHSGGSVFDEIERNCYVQWERHDTERKEQGPR